jgi:ribosomal protein S18 acetylase RimI-like enzyme
MIIRQATIGDAHLLSSLNKDVQSLHAQNHPAVFKRPESDDFAVSFFEEMLTDQAVRIFIAEDEGMSVGYIVCKLIDRPENPFTFAARTLYIDQVSVRPEAQGKGIGRALIDQAEALGRELNVARIHLDSWDFNLGAHAFFEKMGYQKFNFRFWKRL